MQLQGPSLTFTTSSGSPNNKLSEHLSALVPMPDLFDEGDEADKSWFPVDPEENKADLDNFPGVTNALRRLRTLVWREALLCPGGSFTAEHERGYC